MDNTIKNSSTHNYVKTYMVPDTLVEFTSFKPQDIPRNIEAFTASPENPAFNVKDGILFRPNERILMAYPPSSPNQDYTTPLATEGISHHAFADTNIKSIHITPLIAYIENDAFKNCTELGAVSGGENLKIIMNSAFEGCTSLQEITINKNVEIVGDRVFADCSNLKKVVINSESFEYGTDVFRGCGSLKEVIVPSKDIKKILERDYIPEGCRIIIDEPLTKAEKELIMEIFKEKPILSSDANENKIFKADLEKTKILNDDILLKNRDKNKKDDLDEIDDFKDGFLLDNLKEKIRNDGPER
jgi:hypothetical protein